MVNHFWLWILFFILCQNTRGNRITASDQEDHAKTLMEIGDGGHAVRSEYESSRNKLLSKLEPGDHIAAVRKKGMYEHHGIYEGTDRGYPSVIHFQGPIKSFAKGGASLFCTFDCGYWHPEKGGKVISCIDCFSQRQKMFKMQYMLQYAPLSDQDPIWDYLEPGNVIAGYRSELYYLEHYLDGQLYGHSHVAMDEHSTYKLDDQLRYYPMPSHRSAQDVLEVAYRSKVKHYSLRRSNCEHFAVFCKTGIRRCIQIENAHTVIVCENGRHESRFRSRRLQNAENGHQILLEEVCSPEYEPAVEVEHRGLLKSVEGV